MRSVFERIYAGVYYPCPKATIQGTPKAEKSWYAACICYHDWGSLKICFQGQTKRDTNIWRVSASWVIHAWTFTRSWIVHGDLPWRISPGRIPQRFAQWLLAGSRCTRKCKRVCCKGQPVVYRHFDSCIRAMHGWIPYVLSIVTPVWLRKNGMDVRTSIISVLCWTCCCLQNSPDTHTKMQSRDWLL